MIKIIKLKNCFFPFLCVLLVIPGCKENYEPPAIQTTLNYLVVDGFLNNSTDTTFIRLSRTKKISEGVRNSAEPNAQLSIEDAGGNALYYFQEPNSDGTYILPGLSLDVNSKYRLRINTANGKQYLSDDIPVVKTPPIDSISWEKSDKGLTIFANTHDPQNSTWYYRWEYVETWEYHAAYASIIKYENGQILDRTPEEYIWDCWRTNQSSELLLASSARLSRDIISNNPVRFIQLNSTELSIMYSILLKQYALTKEAFEYTENLKKFTEQTGSIFDAQPSQLTGNFRSLTDPAEPVLGFVTASSKESKRRFISNSELSPWFLPFNCLEFEIKPPIFDSLEPYLKDAAGYLPTRRDGFGPSLKGIFAAPRPCVDCTLQGGVTTKPDFWP